MIGAKGNLLRSTNFILQFSKIVNLNRSISSVCGAVSRHRTVVSWNYCAIEHKIDNNIFMKHLSNVSFSTRSPASDNENGGAVGDKPKKAKRRRIVSSSSSSGDENDALNRSE